VKALRSNPRTEKKKKSRQKTFMDMDNLFYSTK
jgi:hypothetical protein